MIKFVIHRSFFFENALVEYIGVCTDTNKAQSQDKWIIQLGRKNVFLSKLKQIY